MGLFDGILNVLKPVTTPLASIGISGTLGLAGALGFNPTAEATSQIVAQATPVAQAAVAGGIIAGGAIAGGVVAAPVVASALGTGGIAGTGTLTAIGGLISSHVSDILPADDGSQNTLISDYSDDMLPSVTDSDYYGSLDDAH